MRSALKVTILGTAAIAVLLTFVGESYNGRILAQTSETEIPDVIVMAQEAKIGKVSFSHLNHNGGKYSIGGNGPIACVECHHVAQPEAEVLKHPPLRTAWPADRTTTLTADLFKKDAAAAGVASCRSCHARAGETPKLMPAIPQVKHESSTAMITLTNQQALHRNCAGCHAEVVKQNKAIKAPTAMQCNACHKR